MPSASKRSAQAVESDEDSDGQPSQSKRSRPGAYAKGSVMKIRVHNFMVYRDAEVVPGSRLNLILGPNGTGKSTLVCALCLGLAGKPSVLGRADNTQHFVLQGESKGWVEITLSEDDHGRPVTFRRLLKSADNSSDWKINSRHTTEKEVKEKITSLNVQLDNLCQFVPQDKVSEFARKKPDELLAETQKAIGDSMLYNLHQELIKHRKELTDKQQTKAVHDNQLETLRTQNQALQRDVKRFEQREQLLAEELLAKQKMSWVKYHQLQEEWVEEREKLQAAKQALLTKRKELQEAEAPLREKQAAKERAGKQEKQLFKACKDCDDEAHAAAKKLDDLSSDTETRWEELDGLNDREQQRLYVLEQQQKQVDKAKGDVERAEALIQDTSNRKSPEEIRDMNAAAAVKETQAQDIQFRLDDAGGDQSRLATSRAQFCRQLDQLKSQRMQRLKWLDGKHRGMIQFSEWLSKNGNRYRSPVFGPILTEINVEDPTHQRLVEQSLGAALMSRFVTQTAEDLEQLQNDAKEHFRLQITVTHYTGNASQVLLHPEGDASRYERYGVTHTMDEVIECPSIIKHVLNDERGTTRTYIGNNTCNAERFLNENSNISTLMTPTQSYRVIGSQYNPNARSQSVASINYYGQKPLGMGGASVQQECDDVQHNINAIDQQMSDVAREQQTLKQQLEAANRECEAMRTDARRASEATRKLTTGKNKAEQTHAREVRKLESLQKAKSLLENEPQIRAHIDGMNTEAVAELDKLAAALKKQLARMTEHAVADLTHAELKLQVTKQVQEAATQRQEVDRMERTVDVFDRAVSDLRVKVRDAKKSAEDETGPMNDELKEKLEPMPNSLEALEELAHKKREEADAIVCTNPGVMQQFQERSAQISALEGQTATLQEEISLVLSTIADRKERWAPELVRIVGQINENFGSNFRDIASAGEVSLGVMGHANDPPLDFNDPNLNFEKLAIHIKVKFRDGEPLQLLTTHRQSGGERALTTMLYLIAIQGVTVCPFRVVDEINQGMDQIYERQVFKLLSIAAGRPGTPQCFLLTPKLLNDLPYSPEVTILNIVNGPNLQHVKRPFTKAQLLGSRQRLLTAAA